MCVTAPIQSANLPDFARPPIVEAILSVQFRRLEQLAIPHFGVFWQSIRRVYSRSQVHPPLNPVFERFGEQSVSSPQISIEELSSPPVRCWFVDESENRLLQIQNNRFIHNWRKVRIDDEYPRYTAVRQTFETEWKNFCAFLASENLGIPQPNQCEVTYVNHIESVDKHGHPIGLHEMFPSWTGETSGDFLPNPVIVQCMASYEMPNQRGRLHIDFKPAIRRADSKEIILLTLTARGAPASPNLTDVLAWFDLGREWVVRGFTDFTSATMHSLWERQ
jgi:uncharacterized protein (TIGR04255 family)